MQQQADILIVLQNSSLTKGQLGRVEIVFQDADNYSQVQIDVFRCGVENPKLAWSKGTSANIVGGHLTEVDLETKDLPPAFYEIKKIGFHTPKDDTINPESIFFVGGRDFPRIFFEVTSVEKKQRTREEIKHEILSIEGKLESDFLSGVKISGEDQSRNYQVYGFLTGVMITQSMRLGNCELIPYRGLDTKDWIDLINEFFRSNSAAKFEFPYTPELSKQKRNDCPVCIVLFPLIIANKIEDAKSYCYEELTVLAEVLSIYRGGSGRVFAIVLIDLLEDQAQMYTEHKPYVGNLLGGSLAGEDPDSIKSNFDKLKSNPSLRYFLNLYKEARAESSVDFQYLRYWQILETIAESKQFDEKNKLTDFSGKPIVDNNEKQITLGKPIARVYQLIKQHQLNPSGEQYDLWKFIQAWIAMRNATGHFGGFRYKDPLQESNFRYYQTCEKVYEDQKHRNDGFVLRELKELTKLILMREMNA